MEGWGRQRQCEACPIPGPRGTRQGSRLDGWIVADHRCPWGGAKTSFWLLHGGRPGLHILCHSLVKGNSFLWDILHGTLEQWGKESQVTASRVACHQLCCGCDKNSTLVLPCSPQKKEGGKRNLIFCLIVVS